MAKHNKEIDRLRRLVNEGEAFVREGRLLLLRLEAGEAVESPSPTSNKKQKRKALIKDLLNSNKRVKKKDIQAI